MTTIAQIKEAVTTWANEEAKFEKGNAAAGTRARAALAEVAKLTKLRRAEIQEAKNAAAAAKAA